MRDRFIRLNPFSVNVAPWSAERRRKHHEAMLRLTKTPEWKRHNQEAMARRAKNPKWRRANAEMVARVHATPEYRRKTAEALRRVYADPEWRRKHEEQLAHLHADPEAQRKQRESIVRRSKNPKWRTAVALRSKNPEWIRKNAEALARLHADPELQHKRFREMARVMARHPNRPETVLQATLLLLGVRDFQTEVLFPDRSRADVVVGNVVGEFDGGGHWRSGREKVLARDAAKDTRRRALGYTVLRDSDPVRLATAIYLATRKRGRATRSVVSAQKK